MKAPVFVVLATYNGVKHIAEQLNSLLAQSWHCQVYIFDDNSADGTIELIQTHYLKHTNLHLIINEKQMGYVKNFEQGIKYVYELGAHYIALCDQDDIWHSQRIEKMGMVATKKNGPTLIYSDLQMIDANGKTTHTSYLKYRGYTDRTLKPRHSLAIALGQNGVMGNTILMNRSLAQLILPFPKNLHTHDYWISLVAQVHGQCILIPEALVKYRIHTSNTSNSLQSLTLPTKQKIPFWRRALQRNHTLPYKEDSRASTLKYFLNHTTLPLLKHDKNLILGFIHYLDFDKPRWQLAYWMLRHKFIRKGWQHKLRFIYRIFTTKRYQRFDDI